MKPENVNCPECNGPMISRKGKFGIFWGCLQFPLCKGTRDNMGMSREDRESLMDRSEISGTDYE